MLHVWPTPVEGKDLFFVLYVRLDTADFTLKIGTLPRGKRHGTTPILAQIIQGLHNRDSSMSQFIRDLRHPVHYTTTSYKQVKRFINDTQIHTTGVHRCSSLSHLLAPI